MVTGFEDFTAELTVEEKGKLLPLVVDILKTRVGQRWAISNKAICKILKDYNIPKVSEPRIRKVIHYIRENGLVPHLIANSKGYYIAESIEAVEGYIWSLRQRSNSIDRIGDALAEQITGRLFI